LQVLDLFALDTLRWFVRDEMTGAIAGGIRIPGEFLSFLFLLLWALAVAVAGSLHGSTSLEWAAPCDTVRNAGFGPESSRHEDDFAPSPHLTGTAVCCGSRQRVSAGDIALPATAVHHLCVSVGMPRCMIGTSVR